MANIENYVACHKVKNGALVQKTTLYDCNSVLRKARETSKPLFFKPLYKVVI